MFGLGRPSVWTLVVVVFIAYITHSIYNMYQLFHPALCVYGRTRCLFPMLADPTNPEKYLPFQLRVFVGPAGTNRESAYKEVLRQDDFDLSSEFEKVVEMAVPDALLRNRSAVVSCYLLPNGAKDIAKAKWKLSQMGPLSTHMVAQAAAFQLIGGGAENKTPETDTRKQQKRTDARSDTPTPHFRSVLPLVALAEPMAFDWDQIPGEIGHLLQLNEVGHYLPVFYLDQLSYRIRDLQEVKMDTEKLNLTIRYRPVTIGKLRLLITALTSLQHMKQLGFAEKDTDDVKGIFADTNFYFLSLTLFVASIHLLLDFLAFKNDISFWRGRKTMVGLSTRTLLWRCFSQTVIFFYLLDENSSLLVLIPCGVGALIELWKIKKAFKVSFDFGSRTTTDGDGGVRLCSWLPIRVGVQSAAEQETESFDLQGMRYLGYLMTPLCLLGAAYSLLYMPHRSWYSWVVNSVANGVYAFGFLFMLPQLFVNYKLRSVAHLPWRAFMYKAFNTFIDDLFAFIIHMPTAHRVACFRDDAVFLVYLYQRYLYPVDKTRVNEFGESFEDKKDSKKTK